MAEIIISDEFRTLCPEFRCTTIKATVKNTEYNSELWNEIESFSEKLKNRFDATSVKDIPAIAATRDAYRRCGKDPSRYRPSSEALCRRILKGMQLYQINTLVDIINLVSMHSAYPIGGFDHDKIQGDTLTLTVGKDTDEYIGIGRGPLNIAGLPVYKDSIGGIGTPTSDHERTKISLDTTSTFIIINSYEGGTGLQQATDMMKRLLEQYASGTDFLIKEY